MSNELVDEIEKIILKHYPEAHECSDCGTHMECSCDEFDYREMMTWSAKHLAKRIVDNLNIPDRTFIDDRGHTWWWCGGTPDTWKWRRTAL